MVIDHIRPEAAGGLTCEDNLCLACHACNEFKGAQTHARDPQTGRRVRLFNPRTQRWLNTLLGAKTARASWVSRRAGAPPLSHCN